MAKIWWEGEGLPGTTIYPVIHESNAVPPNTIMLINARYDSLGRLDVESTAKASVVLKNVGPHED